MCQRLQHELRLSRVHLAPVCAGLNGNCVVCLPPPTAALQLSSAAALPLDTVMCCTQVKERGVRKKFTYMSGHQTTTTAHRPLYTTCGTSQTSLQRCRCATGIRAQLQPQLCCMLQAPNEHTLLNDSCVLPYSHNKPSACLYVTSVASHTHPHNGVWLRTCAGSQHVPRGSPPRALRTHSHASSPGGPRSMPTCASIP
jgi:hypothetical protein